MGVVGEKIVADALTGAMSPVIGKLSSLIEEFTELKNVSKKLEQLRKELMAINLALEKLAAMEHGPDAQAKAWAAEMRELAYDMEDSIDLFTHHVVDGREPPDDDDDDTAATGVVKRFFLRMIRKIRKLHYRHRFSREIQELHHLVNQACGRRKRYRIQECGSSSSSISPPEIDPRLQALYVEVEKLVGMEGPSQEIIGRLVGVGDNPAEEGRRRRVAAIVGPGGSGKTTLAKQVYEKIKVEFSCVAFVSVSQKPNMSNLLWELLSQIESHGRGSAVRSCGDQQLIDQLRSYLQDERYLVVIDDVWTKSAWETIQYALPRNAHTSSTIIMTTRINSVGQLCCTSDEGFIYPMKPLSNRDSEKLFIKRTFFDAEVNKFPVHLEGIKNEMLEKCDGLPLAIVTLASLLATKPRTKEGWESALNSIRSMHEKDSGLEIIDKILSLSYKDLPRQMKNCLLHLSTFPEDHVIYKDVLEWRWIAEGFITEKQGFTLKQVAESYFHEFINRSLIQPLAAFIHGYIEIREDERCQVHDIVLNFLISRSSEENFITMLDDQGLPSSYQRIRRLSISDNPEHALVVSRGTMDLSHLRSLSIYNVRGWKTLPVFDQPVLRVLDIEHCGDLWNVELDCILTLVHLRYLRFYGTSCVMLPAQIGNLQYLQTLDLRNSGVTQLPKSIVQLKRLMRLVGEQLIMPDGFGNMESLQELGILDGCHCSINFGKDLAILSKLRVLGVDFDWDGSSDLETRKESLMSSLRKLGGCSLRHIFIEDEEYNSDGNLFVDSWCPPPSLLQKFIHTGKYYSRLPKWINSRLCDLTYLDINVDKMERGCLHILDGLPAIRFLYLGAKQVPEDGLIISRGTFRGLTHFQFCNIDGPGLVFRGGMGMLEWLNLSFDVDKAQLAYDSLDIGIGHLSSLKCIVLTVRIVSEGENDPSEESVKSIINGQVKMLPESPLIDIKFRRRQPLAGTEGPRRQIPWCSTM